MNKIISLIVVVIMIVVSSIVATPAAAQVNTSSDSNPGQVRTRNADGTLYLTTAVNNNPNNSTTTPTQQSNTSVAPAANSFSAITGSTLTKPMGFADNIGSYINSILNLTMVISLLLVFYYFISAGFQWITSGGDKGKTEEARNKIVNAIVGIVIVAASYALVTFVAYVLGFSSINEALSNVKQINPS